jgi:PAS domain S-box-containing protein
LMQLTGSTIRQVVLVGFGGVAIALLIAFYMGRSIARPLQQLTNVMTGFASGRTDLPMPRSRKDEIGELATAFNDMVQKRQQAEEELRRLRDEVEVRVGERTTELIKANEALQAENTERKRAEETLRESEEKFGQLADNITDAFWIRSADMRVVHYVSPAYERTWGRSTESLYANPHQWADAILPEDRERVLAIFATLTGAAPNISIEYRIARADGEVRWVHARGFQVRDAAGELIRLTGIVTDITERKRAEEALRESEERFSGAFEHAPIGVALVSSEGRWLKVNRALSDLVGYSETELLTRTFHDITHPEYLEVSLENARRIIAGEIPSYQMEKRYVHARGHLITALLNVSVVRDGQGKPRYFIAQIQDITERKQAEEAAQRSQKRLRDLIDGLGPSMFVGLMTPQGILLEANRPALAAAGLNPEDVLGKSFEETYWWAYSREVQHQLREAITRAARGEASRYDVQVRAAENHLIDVDFSLQPLRDEAGNIVFLVPSASVITDRKQAEKALQESEARTRLLVKSSSIGLWDWNLVTNEVFFSAEWKSQLGYTDAELPSQFVEWESRLHPEDRESTFAAVKDYLEGRRADYNVEFRLRHKDESWRWILTRANPIRDATGQAVRLMGCHIDITERKRSEAELEKTHKELLEISRQAGMAEVATGVLHNVGNVLNSVNVASSCLADSLRRSQASNLSKVVTLLREHEADLGTFLTSDSKGKQLPEYLAQLAEHLAGEQAAALEELAGLQKNIEHIKDIVAMQQCFAQVSGVTETLQVTDLVDEALRMNSPGLLRRDIRVIKEFEKVPSMMVEKHKVLQIIVNLVRNAKQACDNPGRAEKRLTLRVTNGNDRIRIAVTDNGIGIPSENLTRIFGHGFTTKKSGHGFGLHSGALAAKEMGGSLSVHSNGPGTGATFTLELPLQLPGGANG